MHEYPLLISLCEQLHRSGLPVHDTRAHLLLKYAWLHHSKDGKCLADDEKLG